jgi:hypothetical protein
MKIVLAAVDMPLIRAWEDVCGELPGVNLGRHHVGSDSRARNGSGAG